MTTKDLDKLISQYQPTSTQQEEELNNLKFKMYSTQGKYKQFYITPEHTHADRYRRSKGQCCFWDIIGRPTIKRDGREIQMPMLPYQFLLAKALNDNQCTVIRKSRGLGVTEWLCRWVAYNILTDKFPKGSRVCIVTGPRIRTAEDIVSNRFKGLFSKVAPNLFDKERSTLVTLNGIKVEAFPSFNSASLRGLDYVKVLIVDECDWYPVSEQQQIRSAAEGLLAKPNSSDIKIIFVSSPNMPNGLMQQLETDQSGLYYSLFFDYNYGLEGDYPIYDINQIRKAMLSPQFGQEYAGKYLGQIGNVLNSVAINRCIDLGERLAKTAPLDEDWTIPTNYIMSIDIGWSSSRTCIMISRYISGKVQIIYSKEYEERTQFQNIIDEIWRLKTKCNDNLQNIIIDGSAAELYTTLCAEFNQNPSLKYIQEKREWCKQANTYLWDYLFITPIPFNPEAKNMLNHTQRMISETEDDGTAMVGIHPQFQDLLASMRSAYFDGKKLDKTRGVFADTFDSLLMNLYRYRWTK